MKISTRLTMITSLIEVASPHRCLPLRIMISMPPINHLVFISNSIMSLDNLQLLKLNKCTPETKNKLLISIRNKKDLIAVVANLPIILKFSN